MESLDKDLGEWIASFQHAYHDFTLSLMADAERNYLSLPWYFLNAGNMKARGADCLFAPTIKYQLQGSRVIIDADFAELFAFANSTQPPGKVFTYDEIVDFVAEADPIITLSM